MPWGRCQGDGRAYHPMIGQNVQATGHNARFIKTGPSTQFVYMYITCHNEICRFILVEVGYITTPICLVQAAYVLLSQMDKMPKG